MRERKDDDVFLHVSHGNDFDDEFRSPLGAEQQHLYSLLCSIFFNFKMYSVIPLGKLSVCRSWTRQKRWNCYLSLSAGGIRSKKKWPSLILNKNTILTNCVSFADFLRYLAWWVKEFTMVRGWKFVYASCLVDLWSVSLLKRACAHERSTKCGQRTPPIRVRMSANFSNNWKFSLVSMKVDVVWKIRKESIYSQRRVLKEKFMNDRRCFFSEFLRLAADTCILVVLYHLHFADTWWGH